MFFEKQTCFINLRKCFFLGIEIDTGTQSFSQIVIIKRPFENYIKALENISLHYNNYLLCIDERCTLGSQLPFTAFANAGGIIEYSDHSGHIGTPAGHFMGLMEASKILFSTTLNNINKFTSNIDPLLLTKEYINDYLSIITVPENTLFVQQDQKTGKGAVLIKGKE